MTNDPRCAFSPELRALAEELLRKRHSELPADEVERRIELFWRNVGRALKTIPLQDPRPSDEAE